MGGNERDTFFEDALQCSADAARDPSPIVDVDDAWFEQAALDALSGEAAGQAAADAVGAAALSLDREVVRRPARRRRPAVAEPVRERRGRRLGVGGRLVAAGGLLVVLVIGVALIANPPRPTTATPTPAGASARPAATPTLRATKPAVAAPQRRRGAMRRRSITATHRGTPRAPRQRARVQPVASRPRPAVAPPAVAPQPRAVTPAPAPRPSAAAAFPGDLASASSTR